MERFVFKRIEMWLVLLLMMVSLIVGAAWAFGVLRLGVFPAAQIREIREAIVPQPGDDRPLLTRLTAPLAFNPREYGATRETVLAPELPMTPVTVAGGAEATMPATAGMKVLGAGTGARVFVIFGSFIHEERQENLGVIALRDDGTLLRSWPLQIESEVDNPGPHIGMSVDPRDGTVAVNARGVMTAYEWCGGKRWEVPRGPALTDGPVPGIARFAGSGPYSREWHHDITFHDGHFYSFHGFAIARVDAATGEPQELFHGTDLFDWGWRQGLSLFDSRADFFDASALDRRTALNLLPHDPLHMNKVDVLGQDEAADYPGFEPGDMALSLREVNLVLVVRPSEERIVWHRAGLTSRQHDATFIDGAIEIFDNAPFTRSPAIIRLPLDSQTRDVVLDLTEWEMKMRQKGNFERHGEALLTVDDEAGRMILGRVSGEVDFVFENGYLDDGGGDGNLLLLNATLLSASAVEDFEAACTGTGAG